MLELDGGKVKRTPPRVLTPTIPELDDSKLRDKNIKAFDIPKRTKLERAIDNALNERDRIVGDLLDLDDKYDTLEEVIDDQLKNMDIPVINRAVREAVRAFGGDDKITKDIYDKAKATKEAITAAMGVNPLHVPFAKPTKYGKGLTQYSGDVAKVCADINKGFPNKTIYKAQKEKPFDTNTGKIASSLENDGIGMAGVNEDGSVLTRIRDLLDKAKIDILAFLQYKLFWDVIYHKFFKKIILFHPKILLGVLKKWKDKKIIGKFVKPVYCWMKKAVDWFEKIPTVFGLRPPVIGGDITGTDVEKLEFEE